jgi:hypothetical protein
MIGSTISFEYLGHTWQLSHRKATIVWIEFKATAFHPEPQWIATAWEADKGELHAFAMRDMKNVVVESSIERISTMVHHSHTQAGTLMEGLNYCCGCWSIEHSENGLVVRCNECAETRDIASWLSPPGDACN